MRCKLLNQTLYLKAITYGDIDIMSGRGEREKATYRSGVHVKEARDALCPSTQQMFCLNNELYQKWTAEENERKIKNK